MKTIIIIQARMGSSRLPGKVLKPLGNTVVLDYVVSRAKKIKDIDELIVATSQLPQDDLIEQWCISHETICFRGSEEDVLSRYYECAKRYLPDYVIRITADCPFLDFYLANQIVDAMKLSPADIAIIKGELPRGLVVEMISFSALEYIYHHGMESRHREHVTYFAYEYPALFKQTNVEAPVSLCFPKFRITLDTIEDYQLCQSIADFFDGDKLVPTQRVVDYLLDHPEVAQINAHIKQKPVI